uniref:C-type lectin domain family 4 member G n=1 Tax=Sus scrofa TaxID=9823 RepID=A0A4X1VNW4_PIG
GQTVCIEQGLLGSPEFRDGKVLDPGVRVVGGWVAIPQSAGLAPEWGRVSRGSLRVTWQCVGDGWGIVPASKQTATLKVLKEEVRACNSCCLGVQAQLQTVHTQLGEAKAKLLEQESALKELSERVTQGLAEAGRDRENIRSELFRELERVRFQNSEQDPKEGEGRAKRTLLLRLAFLEPPGSVFDFGLISVPPSLGPGSKTPLPNPLRLLHLRANHLFNLPHPAGSCEQCPKSWLPFQGSCYFFSAQGATWVEAQSHCEGAGAHLVIVGGLEEQGFLSRNTAGRGYWLGLRAVRRARKIQSYQWVDGVPLSFSHWNLGEPNDSLGREDCIMMLRTGMWNDAPCNSKDDSWICEKRHNC